jgi:hypothetical protein
MLVNLLVDVTYGIINPRIRQGGTEMAAVIPRAVHEAARPGPLREFWISFLRQPAAPSAAWGGRGAAAAGAVRALDRAALPDQTNSAAFLKPPRGRRAARRSTCWARTRSAATSCRA